MGTAAPVIKIAVAVAAVGAQIAMSAMQPPVQGPRLGDLSVSAATYGLPIAVGFGVCRLGGNMIWTSGIKESSHTSKGGKGFGAKSTTFTYSSSFAFAFAAGPCARILRVWADSKLVYDETGATLGVPGVTLRQYYGTEDQLPDSAISADKGAVNTPAFRGLVYLVAEDVPLAPFGNRIPNISAEIAFQGGTVSNDVTFLTPLPTADDPLAGWVDGGFRGVFDWARNVQYRRITEGGQTGIMVVDTNTMHQLRTATLDSIFAGTLFGDPPGEPPGTGILDQNIWGLTCGNGTDLYMAVGDLFSNNWIVRVNPETMKATGQIGPTNVFSDYDATDGVVNKVFSSTTAYTTILGYVDQGRGVAMFDGTAMTFLGHAVPTPRLTNPSFNQLVPGAQNPDGSCEFWLINFDLSAGSDLDIWKIKVFLGGAFETSSVTMDGNAAISGVANIWVHRLEYDRTNAALIMWITDGVLGADQVLASVDPFTGAVNWVYTGPTRTGLGTSSGYSLLDGTTLGMTGVDSTHAIILDTRTGTLVTTITLSSAASSWYEAYNSRTETDYTNDFGHEAIRLDRGVGAPALLSDIVEFICVEAGLTVDEIDTTALTDEVRGYTHVQEIARNLIADLSGAFFFDGAESDYILKFVKRGGSPVVTVPYADALPPSSGSSAALPVKRNQAEDIARRVWVRYPDTDNNQQQGTQYWARSQAPTSVSVINSAGEATMDLRIVFNASEAKTLAKKRLLMLWQERDTLTDFGLPPSYLALDPTDVINVTMRDGDVVRVRIEKAAIGADLSCVLSGTIEDATLLGVTATGDGGTGVTPTLIPTPYSPTDAQYEMPLIRDTDDTGQTALREYAAFGAYSGQTFGGASLYVSADNATWTPLLDSNTSMKWGVAANALPAPPVSPWVTDTVNYLDVSMVFGGTALETATRAQILEGANAAILAPITGEVEVIQFTTVTPLGGSLYRLTGLVRGRRGSEWACGRHNVGDRFVLLDTATWREASVPLGWVGVTRYNKLLGVFDSFDSVMTTTRVYEGTAEKPYAPVFVTGSYDGSNNLVLTWVRRTRIGGEWIDGIEVVPLSEATESYSVDILSSGVVVRTLTSVTSPTATYTAADQITDGLDAAAKDISVFQISAIVGRGFAGTATIAAP